MQNQELLSLVASYGSLLSSIIRGISVYQRLLAYIKVDKLFDRLSAFISGYQRILAFISVYQRILAFISVYQRLLAYIRLKHVTKISDRTPTHAKIGPKPTSDSKPIEHVTSTINKPEIRDLKNAHETDLPSNSLLKQE